MPTNQYRDMIERAIQDELRTSRFYYSMSGAATNPVCASLLASASNDEYRHAQMLSAILAGHGPGAYESVLSAAVDPADLEKAVRGELTAISEYATLAGIAPSSQERLLMMSILGDEYGHARMFMSMQASGCI